MTTPRRLAALALLTLGLAGCGTEPPAPHPLTIAEAERLALVRYTNYEAKVSSVLAHLPTGAGTLVLDGRVDFVNHIGHVTLTTEGRTDPAATGLLQWNPQLVAFHPGIVTGPLPPDGWQLRPLQDKASELDALLLLLLNIATDRPDNPQLLQQSAARWLRTETLAGTQVDVIEGPGNPARLTYWVDANGNLPRLHARIGDHSTPATINLTPGAPPITPLPAITPR